MSDVTCTDLTDARILGDRVICLTAVSKDVKGELRLLDAERQRCETDRCETLKTDHLLVLEVMSHRPCDAVPALDGRFVVRRFVTAFADGSGTRRGLHTGEFAWIGNGLRLAGTMSGLTNEGTHREPAFDPACQKCDSTGVLEGRLCGRVVRSADPALLGTVVTAAYRFRFDASEDAGDTAVQGTIEGLLVEACERCTDFRAFGAGSHANPWVVDGHTYTVFDHTGTPTATTEIRTWGASTGLDMSFRTQVDLTAPASAVDATLVHFAQPATVTALDAGGTVVDSQVMTAPGGSPQTLHLAGAGITTVVVEPPNDETLLLELCVS
jgi:hypothetical protein